MGERSRRILVVGEVCNDIFVYGSASRLCPDVPAPVFKAFSEVCTKGMAGNTKSNLESLGHGVDILNQQNKITKTRFVDDKLNYTFLRVDDGESFGVDAMPHDLISDEEISKYEAVVISDYGKGFLTESCIKRFCENNPNTFIDTKKCIGDWCKDAAFIKINTPEYEAIKDSINLADWEGKLIVTRGSSGCMIFRNGGFDHFDVDKVDVFDLSGAGDSFLAALVSKFLDTRDVDESIKYANQKASEIVQQRGVNVITK